MGLDPRVGFCLRHSTRTDLARLVVGRAYQVRYRLLDNREQPFANRGITVDVVAEGFDRLADFPEATRAPLMPGANVGLCSSCSVPSTALDKSHRRGGSVVLETGLGLAPAIDQPVVRLSLEGLGSRDWQPGEEDPLALAGTLTLSADQPQAARLAVTLEDAFGNPLTGRRVQIYSADVTPDQPVPDAGAAVEDAGATDVSNLDSGAVDAGLDGGLPADAGSADAGGEQLPSTAQAPTILVGTATDGCE